MKVLENESLKVFLFVLLATVFEAVGDAVVRLAIANARMPVRVGLFVAGSALMAELWDVAECGTG